VKEQSDVRGYNGNRVQADIVAVLEGEFDLGWQLQDDGSFSLIGDLWGVSKKHNQAELINSINQKYAINKTLAEAATNQALKGATVRVQVTEMAYA
jgi:hypothetical protein